MINVTKLTNELQTAGIPIDGCNSSGEIWFKQGATAEQKALAEQIKTNHNQIWYIEERLKRYPPVGDQLDYIYKTFKNLKANGIILGIDGDEWIAAIDKVKADWPK